MGPAEKTSGGTATETRTARSVRFEEVARFVSQADLTKLQTDLKRERQLREAFEIMTLTRYHYAERGKWPENIETLLLMNCYSDQARIDHRQWELRVTSDAEGSDWMIIVESTDGQVRRTWSCSAWHQPRLSSL
jgi:hypothetical protein